MGALLLLGRKPSLKKAKLLGIFSHQFSHASFAFASLSLNAFIISERDLIMSPPLFVAVDDSAILDCHFSDFYHTAPQGFEKILFEQQIF